MKTKLELPKQKPLWELVKRVKSPIFKDYDPKPKAARVLDFDAKEMINEVVKSFTRT